MTTQPQTQPQKNPYTFKKNAWHVKLFNWCYGVYPPQVFPTICPYFWSWIGTFIIFPFIILAKLLRVPSKNIGMFISKQITMCKEYSNKRREAKAKIKAEKWRQIKARVFEVYKLFVVNPIEINAIALKKQLKQNDLDIEEMKWYWRDTIDNSRETYSKLNELSGSYYRLVDRYNNKQAQIKKEKIQHIQNTVSNNIIGKIIFGLITVIGVGLILFGAGFGLYSLIIQFIIPQITLLLYSLLFLIIVGGLIYLIVKFFQCWGETIGDWIKKFVFMFKPLLNISLIFVWIWTGIKLFCGMVYSIYKQQCPLITWED